MQMPMSHCEQLSIIWIDLGSLSSSGEAFSPFRSEKWFITARQKLILAIPEGKLIEIKLRVAPFPLLLLRLEWVRLSRKVLTIYWWWHEAVYITCDWRGIIVRTFAAPLVLAVLKKPFGHSGAEKKQANLYFLLELRNIFIPSNLSQAKCKTKMFPKQKFPLISDRADCCRLAKVHSPSRK